MFAFLKNVSDRSGFRPFCYQGGRLDLGLNLYVRLCCGWLLIGLFRASHLAMSPPYTFLDIAVPQVIMAFTWATLTWLIFRIAYGIPFNRIDRWGTLLILYVPTAVVVTALAILIQLLALELISRWDGRDYGLFFMSRFHATLLDAFIVLGIAYAVRIRDEQTASAIVAAQLETQLANAQMQALRSQMQPHFLFNVLHSVSSMIRSSPGRAESMLSRLSELLRMSIDVTHRQIVGLSSEIEFARHYLEIQQIRFSDRLEVIWDVDPAVVGARVPNFLLQPIVENSIKHAIARSDEPGFVQISARAADGYLLIEIVDSGAHGASGSPDISEREGGIGLANLRTRLDQVYGTRATLQMEQEPSGGMRVTVRIPILYAA